MLKCYIGVDFSIVLKYFRFHTLIFKICVDFPTTQKPEAYIEYVDGVPSEFWQNLNRLVCEKSVNPLEEFIQI